MTVRVEIARIIYKKMKYLSLKCKSSESIHNLEVLEKMADKASTDVCKMLDEERIDFRAYYDRRKG